MLGWNQAYEQLSMFRKLASLSLNDPYTGVDWFGLRLYLSIWQEKKCFEVTQTWWYIN